MKTTSYLIERRGECYTLKCVDGPHKLGLESITADDGEASLVTVLSGLGVPASQVAVAVEEVRSECRSFVTFDANLR